MKLQSFLSSPRFLDRAEQVIVTILFLLLIRRVWPETFTPDEMFSMLVIISEGIVVLFIVLRRPTDQISMRFTDWALAASGTFLSLLVAPSNGAFMPMVAVPIMLTGIVIHTGAKLSLNRSFGLVAANRGVRSSGMYLFVRHPMYAGYLIADVGYLMIAPSLRNFLIYTGVAGLLVARIYAEERLLKHDKKYVDFSKQVKFRLVPGLF